MSSKQQQALRFLDKLEQREARLLQWGVVDGSFEHDELEQLGQDYLGELYNRDEDLCFSKPGEVLDWLVHNKLLFPLPEGERYRTRMAESVRLFSQLRQLFPQHIENGTWGQASSLVSDFRLLTRPRAFPKRDQRADELITKLRQQHQLTNFQADIARQLTHDDAEPWRLSGFQARATGRVLEEASSRRGLGTIVCAGTGSGKTLAFYLPTFISIGAHISDSRWTQTLAIYPRNELLKDQFSEALRMARRVRSTFHKHERRGVVLAALYGGVPLEADRLRMKHAGWDKRGQTGYICPFARCPDCQGELIWKMSDFDKKHERLECTTSECGGAVTSDEVILTRKSAQQTPPDILFTSTEMLNQRISDATGSQLFGLHQPQGMRPHLVLLDEVHTYEGVHGAHVANLMKRWKKAAKTKPHFVGLSATLADARNFFSSLVGLYPDDVQVIEPVKDEMTYEGKEYMLALRGNPVSSASLLSTTIQTIMLSRRILQSNNSENRYYGRKVFAFTDDLDVTNRLFHDTLDAEGRTDRNAPMTRRKYGSLANFRDPLGPDSAARIMDGQSWDLCYWLGHQFGNLAGPKIQRVSSQDAGVDLNAEIIVATASLEVGYDDPDVGAVIQHKAPRAAAPFLQRKGRAGRSQEMRPWTIVVLSDYGRDRLAYRSYEQLFSPKLPARTLPLQNRYVLRIQITYTLIDWLGLKLHSHFNNGHAWRSLAAPTKDAYFRKQQNYLQEVIDRLLTDKQLRDEFQVYAKDALGVNEEQIEALFWDPPRALLSAVLPTAQRRLDSEWKRADGEFEPYDINSPLPEFVPQSLFSELNLPDVNIVALNDDSEPTRLDSMGIRQALSEFAPGRVSRRYGIEKRTLNHWIEPPNDGEDFDIEKLCPHSHLQQLGPASYFVDGQRREISLFRPHTLQLQCPPKHISVSSYSRLRWHTQLLPTRPGHKLETPIGSSWEKLVTNIAFQTFQMGNPVEVRRFASGADYELKMEGGTAREGSISFTTGEADSRQPAAIGFRAYVDGICFKLNLPDSLYNILQEGNTQLLRTLRPAYFEHSLLQDTQLQEYANKFQVKWLADIWLATLAGLALDRGITLEESSAQLMSDDGHRAVNKALALLMNTDYIGVDEASQEANIRGRLHIKLSGLLKNDDVMHALQKHSAVLWIEPNKQWEEWLRGRLKSTIGAAFLEASQQLCPQLNADDLVLDIESGPGEDEIAHHNDIWLSESSVGGVGFVEELQVQYAEDPRRFFELVDAALAPADLELVDSELGRILQWLSSPNENAETRDAIQKVRDTSQTTQAAYLKAVEALRETLYQKGVALNHAVSTALHTRLLKNGSSPDSDKLVGQLRSAWIDAEENLGMELDGRIFAMVVASREDFLTLLKLTTGLSHSELTNPSRRLALIDGLLWARGGQVRSQSLTAQNLFMQLPDTERLLLRHFQEDNIVNVDLLSPDWYPAVAEQLRTMGRVVLHAPLKHRTDLRRAIMECLAKEIDVNGLFFYPMVRSIARTTDTVKASLALKEALQ